MAAKELALLQFDVAFKSNGFSAVPRGLWKILENYQLKKDENCDIGRRRMYRRLFGILWFGNKVGQNKFSPKKAGGPPTYVYPDDLKKVIRAIIQHDVQDYDDPTGASVYKVTIKDLAEAKWPAAKN